MLLAIAGLLALLWLIGLLVHVGGALIHLLLVIALIAFVAHFVTANRHPA